MPNRIVPARSLLHVFGIVFAVAGLLFPCRAEAGFEWVAPTQAPPDLTPAPYGRVQQAGPEIISPVVIEGNTSAAQAPVIIGGLPPNAPSPAPAPTHPVVGQSLGTVEALPPLAASPAPPLAAAEPEAEAVVPAVPLPVPVSAPPSALPPLSSASPYPVVHGFANNVPLAVALRQILPPGYGFSIDQDVDLGTLVSFKGGKPWEETLADMLDPAGLVSREQDHMISIGHGAAPIAAAALPPAAPPPALQTAESLAPPAPSTVAASDASDFGVLPDEAPPLADLGGDAEPDTSAIAQASPPAASPMAPPPVAGPLSPTPPLPSLHTLPAPSAARAVPGQSWVAERGTTLHKVLQDWSRRAGIEFEWQAEYDYPLAATITFNGSFEDAVRNILAGFQDAHPQPYARLYDNPDQKVLVVEARGNSYSD